MAKAAKIIVTYPSTGTERKFDVAIYEPFKSAILRSLKVGELTHKELHKAVLADFKRTKIKFEGSVEWYMESVKLDLEATKAIERIIGKPPKWKIAK